MSSRAFDGYKGPKEEESTLFEHSISSTDALSASKLPRCSQTEQAELARLLKKAAESLGSFPRERQILSRHYLQGFTKTPFEQTLLYLHKITGAHVLPHTQAQSVERPTALQRARRKLGRCLSAYYKKHSTEPELWSYIRSSWSLREGLLYEQELVPQNVLIDPWDTLGHLLTQLAPSFEQALSLIHEALWLTPGWACFWSQSLETKTELTQLCALTNLALLLLHRAKRPGFPGKSLTTAAFEPVSDSLVRDRFELQFKELDSSEAAYRSEVEATLNIPKPRESATRPLLQALFCIDPRCESFRSQWEQEVPELQTFSCSGAFALSTEQTSTSLTSATVEKLAEILHLIDLTHDFARLVVIAGHSHSDQDPWHAGFLECTACGGHSGAPHARFTADALNQPQIRVALHKLGISIPPETHFVAAVLKTWPQQLEILDQHKLPETHAADFEILAASLEALSSRRGSSHVRALSAKEKASERWLGLSGGAAGHAGFIIAPRTLSRAQDLKGRCFLHSYDCRQDEEGEALARILRGALRVAVGINLQFYFAALDPLLWGAGLASRLQTLPGGLKVRGSDGDLTLGLPLEALHQCEGRPHEALRLQVFIQADAELIRKAFALAPDMQKAWGLAWFQVIALDRSGRAQLIASPDASTTPKTTPQVHDFSELN